ncbi:MAG: HlyD family efflux transporter periplasmic adaptor subunit [Phenylobacterium sp.]|jgi:multidrug efflux pump subunit AcrA (membrane-fusion protein)|uniref:efflux RND transporter periplasmic adaptor subunit n=1 Tax=Phenylobacterium sp. TaxID=1871053 RepID=UPI0025E1169E|nr:HlyD family efflux transporter periplasmic adaptor subunit [Phenylobacterium sp.]MCA6244208.1 HlyD family efflux transporter periplasmic adaptor subunit [Phenylobacterium sp.]
MNRRQWLALGAVALFALLALWLYARARSTTEPAQTQSVVVQPAPFKATIDVAGVIAAGERVDVVAPFDGPVARLEFTYGDPVSQGQVLMRMDVSDLGQRLRDAKSAYLKAQQVAADMRNWSSGVEVSRARRTLQSAELDSADARRKATETRMLLDRGLVPRSEYEALTQQLRSQELSAATAREELSAALRRGQGPNREMAELDLRSATARLTELEEQQAKATTVAPVAGVFVRPASAAGAEGDGIHVGQRLARGQLVGSIVQGDSLTIEVPLNEADANRVKVGQRAEISGGGFGTTKLNGHVISVAGEARPSPAGNGSSVVMARVRMDHLPTGQQQLARIGMTANVAIVVYETAAALVVPPQALLGSAPEVRVMVIPKAGAARSVKVLPGQATPDGVEVKSGLKAGDTVVWSVPRS